MATARTLLIASALLFSLCAIAQGGCPYFPGGMDANTCAYIFEGTYCTQRYLLIHDTEEIGNLHTIKPKSTTWKNRISSVAIRFGCELDLYKKTNMNGEFLDLTANSSSYVLADLGQRGFNNKAQSLTCNCRNSSTCHSVTEQWEQVLLCSGTVASTCDYTYDVAVLKGKASVTSVQSSYSYGVSSTSGFDFFSVAHASLQTSWSYDQTKTVTDAQWGSISHDQRIEVKADRPANHTFEVIQRTKRCGDYVWMAPVIAINDITVGPSEYLASPHAASLPAATLQKLRQMRQQDDRDISLRPEIDGILNVQEETANEETKSVLRAERR